MNRRGLVLVAVLVVIALVAMIGAGLLFRMSAEVSASGAGAGGRQAYSAAFSGLQHAIAVLRDHADESDLWLDNPDLFRNQLVWDDGSNRWYFTLYADSLSDAGTIRYGVTDECGKIDLNTADEATLLALPNMTAELAACLMDYRDSDSNTLPNGAEQDYYDRLPRPYVIRNGPLASLDELLLVKGFHAQIVYGSDANLNGGLDANEDDGNERFPPDPSSGQFNPGLRDVARVVSYAPPADEADAQKIDLNDASADFTPLDLPAQTVEFIRLYRADGNQFKHPSELLAMRYQLKKDASAASPGKGGKTAPNPPAAGKSGRRRRGATPTPAPTPAPSADGAQPPADGAQPSADGSQPPAEGGPKAGDWIESGVGSAELPIVMEKLSVAEPASARAGRVNVNTAPEGVLAVLPGMKADTARGVVELRKSLSGETKGNLAWLYTQGAVDAPTFKAVAPLLVTRSRQFYVRCVGFGSPVGRYRILEALVDLSGSAPRIMYLRDLTRLGLPFALKPEESQL